MKRLCYCLFLLLVIMIGASPNIAQSAGAANTVSPTNFDNDVRTLAVIRKGFQETIAYGRSRTDIFTPGQKIKNSFPKRDEKNILWGMWSRVLDYTMTLDGLRGEHKDFMIANRKADKSHAFIISNGCFLAQFRYALEFIDLAEKNPVIDTILNEEVPEMGLSRDTYKQFKFRFLNAARATEFTAMQIFEKRYGKGSSELKKANEEDSTGIMKMGMGRGYELTAKNAVDIVGKGAFSIWFPAQKGVSTWMGDVRVRRQGTALISHDQIKAMVKKLEPGDILIERREWYLSNLGLPGFWTHAALYVGTPEERKRFFTGPAIQEWVRGQGITSGDFEDLLRTRYQKPYEINLRPDQAGNAPRVLEAISEGVSFSSIEHTAEADSFAILRPRLNKQDKAFAILRGFHYSGRPYDFNFDFLTDSTLVCSELVYKVYEPSASCTGIRLTTEKVMGRTLVTPNTMARQFDEEYEMAERQIDLVLFLDGYEKNGKAIETTQDAFRKSWKRPKWHIIFQEEL